MSDLVFIPDGYTVTRKIRAQRGLHGSLEFAFRPLVAEQRDEFRQQFRGADSNKMNAALRNLLSRQIVSWDVKDPKTGAALPIAEDTIRRLHPKLYDAMYFVICGDEPGDLPENATEREKSDFLREIENGGNAGETAQKN